MSSLYTQKAPARGWSDWCFFDEKPGEWPAGQGIVLRATPRLMGCARRYRTGGLRLLIWRFLSREIDRGTEPLTAGYTPRYGDRAEPRSILSSNFVSLRASKTFPSLIAPSGLPSSSVCWRRWWCCPGCTRVAHSSLPCQCPTRSSAS